MKRSHVLVFAAVLGVGGVVGGNAVASMSKLGTSSKRAPATRIVLQRAPVGGGAGTSSGRIGSAPPIPNAAAQIRALGLDDEGGPESGDDGGGLPGGRVAHGSIGRAAPSANAASRIRALGADD